MSDPSVKSAHYDVIVVGAGPAGISAAINVANRKRTVAVFDSQQPFAKTRKAPKIPNYPGFSFATGVELAQAFTTHLEEFGVPFFKEKIAKIMPDEDEILVFSDQDMYHARAVIVATGVYLEADLEGEDALVGQGVSYCANCDGRLFSGREVAFVSYIPEGEEEAAVLAQDLGVAVTYVPLYEGEYVLPEGVRVVDRQRPDGLYRRDGKIHVQLKGEDLVVDGVFVHKQSVSPRDLVDGLELDGPHIVVDRRMRTSIGGIFAAGDCAGEPYQIAKAVGEGQVAALEALRHLREKQAPRVEEPPALKAEDRASLSRILSERMVGPVRMIHFTQKPGEGQTAGPVCENCREGCRLLQELADLSPKLSLEIHDFVVDAERARELAVERIPATLIGGPDDPAPRVRFYGVPTGYEFGLLLDDILDASIGRSGLLEETLEALSFLGRPVHMEVMTTSTCPRCPEVGRLVHRAAAASPMITGDVVMISEFPEVAQRHTVSNVPKVVVDGIAMETGRVDEGRLLDWLGVRRL